jgi:ABC-2 type transport system ATP-binding protein
LAGAILHDPKVLVLDEPTVGLDPKQIIAIRELIRELGRERTLLLSTHILPEVELLCQRVLIIDRGRIVAQGSPQELRERWLGALGMTVEFASAAAGQHEALAGIAGVATVDADEANAARFVVACAKGSDPREEVFRLAVARGWSLIELSPTRASLEDIFVRLTTRDRDEAPTAAEEVAS